MAEPCKSYDFESALRFPLVPYAHQTAWRYIFDWAIAGEALKCVPGELVLEFAAGPGYASEWLNRLGYRTISLDLDAGILGYAQERMRLDQWVQPARASFAAADGQRLPFADATFDGVVCLNALHHMPDYSMALAEIRRVIKPGGRAVFSEPGSRHAGSVEARLAAEQYGAVEKSVVLDEVHRIAQEVGFERMILKPFVYPHLVDLDYDQLEDYRHNRIALSHTRPDQVARFLEQAHSIFVLAVPGERRLTSAFPGVLRADIQLSELPVIMQPGQEINVQGVVRNIGDTVWLAKQREFGGHVTFGAKLCRSDGRLLSAELARTALEQDVPPGSAVEIQSGFRLPQSMAAGEYILRFDLVNEQIAWFEQFGSPVPEHHFKLVEGHADLTTTPTMKRPRPRRSVPAQYALMTEIAGAALAKMGMTNPSNQMLEPIARAVRSLFRR